MDTAKSNLPDLYGVPTVTEKGGCIPSSISDGCRAAKRRSLRSWVRILCPLTTLFSSGYSRGWLYDDMAAGVCVGLMVIPQGLSYANLAGLPTIYGLYGACIPPIIYGLFGSSRQLAVGPVAVSSLLLQTGLNSIFGANEDPNNPKDPVLQAQLNTAATQVALYVGLLEVMFGLLDLSWLTNFLSHTVISGFTTGAATIIALSQAQYIFGIRVKRESAVYAQIINIFKALPSAKARELGLSLGLITIIILCKWLGDLPANRFKSLRAFFLGGKSNYKNNDDDDDADADSILRGEKIVEKGKDKDEDKASLLGEDKRRRNKKDSSKKEREQDESGVEQDVNNNSNNSNNDIIHSHHTLSVQDLSGGNPTANNPKPTNPPNLKNSKNNNNHHHLTALPPLRLLKGLGPIIATTLAIALSAGFKLGQGPQPKIQTLGFIPAGFPPFTGGSLFPMINGGRLIMLAITVVLVDLCESLSIAKAMAQRNRYDLSVRNELFGLGFANITGSCFSCYNSTGSFSRTAVANSVGAKSRLFTILSGCLVLLVLLILTPVFGYMPKSVQGAVVVTAAVSLMNFGEFFHVMKISKVDGFIWLLACLVTMGLGTEYAVPIAVGFSLLVNISKSAFPHISSLGALHIPDPSSLPPPPPPHPHPTSTSTTTTTNVTLYRDMNHYVDAKPIPGVLIVKPHAPLWFANVGVVKQYIADKVKLSSSRRRNDNNNTNTNTNTSQYGAVLDDDDDDDDDEGDDSNNKQINMNNIHTVIIDLSAVSHMDNSSQVQLGELQTRLAEGGGGGGGEGVKMMFADPSITVMKLLQKSRADYDYHIYPSVHHAVAAAALQSKDKNRDEDE